MENAIAIIEAAIANQRCLAVRYKGQHQVRVLEPHLLYKTRSGAYMVEAYQVRGHSAGGRVPPYWRPFGVRKITTIQVLPELFETRLKEGFETIRRMISGEVLCGVNTGNKSRSYFNAGVYGPPKPEAWGDTTRRLQSVG